jgi:hypothetical protein
MSIVRNVALGDLCTFEKGTYATLKTNPGEFPLVVTAEFRRTADSWQLEGPAVCVPLISSTGHGDAALHRVHYQEGRFALANLLVALRPKNPDVLYAKYLYYLLMARKDQLLVPLMLGTANVSLKERDIASVRVSLPPIAQQRRIVERVEAIAGNVDEAKRLMEEADGMAADLLIGLAHRGDLSDKQKAADGWVKRPLCDVLLLVEDPVPVDASNSYPNVGIYSFGRGLFAKEPISGLETSASRLFRIRSGQFIYSRLFAFEGAYGAVTPEFDGAYVSNEYPMFNCEPELARVEFVVAYFQAPTIWRLVAAGSKGLGDRRQRVHPDQVLHHELWVPPIEYQERLVRISRDRADVKSWTDASLDEIDALVPAVLDRTFRREL